jgi:hypothetical protein
VANQITFGYTVGRTLTYKTFLPDGTPKTTVTSLPETSVGVSGYYTATDASVIALDIVIVLDSVLGVVGWGQYQPEVTSPSLTIAIGTLQTDVTTINGIVSQMLGDESITRFSFDERGVKRAPRGPQRGQQISDL